MKITYRMLGKVALIASVEDGGETVEFAFGEGAVGSLAVGNDHLILRGGSAVCPRELLGDGTVAPVLYLERDTLLCEPFTLGEQISPAGATREMLAVLFTECFRLTAENSGLKSKVAALEARVNGTVLL